MAKAKKNEIILKEENVNNVDLSSIKEELTTYIDKEIKANFNDEVKKVYNKLLRDKSRKVFIRDIIILILLAIIGLLLYTLYDFGYFDKYFNNNNNETVVVNNNIDKENEIIIDEPKGPTLEELKNEYSYLLLNVKINEKSNYAKDFYSGNLTDEVKNYIALYNINFSELVVDEDCNIIEDGIFKTAYNKVFNGEYTKVSFDFNGNKVKYINKLESFITTSVLENTASNIQREIIDIKVDNDNVSITTVEGIVDNGKLYNIVTGSEVKKFKNDSILNYQDNLTKITYTFVNGLLEKIS